MVYVDTCIQNEERMRIVSSSQGERGGQKETSEGARGLCVDWE